MCRIRLLVRIKHKKGSQDITNYFPLGKELFVCQHGMTGWELAVMTVTARTLRVDARTSRPTDSRRMRSSFRELWGAGLSLEDRVYGFHLISQIHDLVDYGLADRNSGGDGLVLRRRQSSR